MSAPRPGADRRSLLVGAAALIVAAPRRARAQASAPQGPRKRIAVARFAGVGTFWAALGGVDLGDVLADQFSTILAASGLFDVVDRADVTMVLKEQSLKPASATQGEAADNPADLLGAQVIVRGTVTTYEPDKGGGGLSFGVGSNVLGRQSHKAIIGIDIRLVDTTSGRILGAIHVQDTATSSNLTLSYTAKNGQTVNSNRYNNSPIGQATERAFQKAAPQIAGKLQDVAWSGRIADVAGGEAFINVGGANGVRVGQVFAVSRIQRRIIDPLSGELLGVSEAPVGEVQVVEVQDRFSKVAPDHPMALSRGDIARFVR